MGVQEPADLRYLQRERRALLDGVDRPPVRHQRGSLPGDHQAAALRAPHDTPRGLHDAGAHVGRVVPHLANPDPHADLHDARVARRARAAPGALRVHRESGVRRDQLDCLVLGAVAHYGHRVRRHLPRREAPGGRDAEGAALQASAAAVRVAEPAAQQLLALRHAARRTPHSSPTASRNRNCNSDSHANSNGNSNSSQPAAQNVPPIHTAHTVHADAQRGNPRAPGESDNARAAGARLPRV